MQALVCRAPCDDKLSIFHFTGYGRTGSDPAVHSTSSMKTYNLKWYQRDQQRRHSTKNREAKGTPPSHCSTEQLIQNCSKVNNNNNNKKKPHSHTQTNTHSPTHAHTVKHAQSQKHVSSGTIRDGILIITIKLFYR